MEFKILNTDELNLLLSSAGDVFDYNVNTKFSSIFLSDPRHHIAVAIENNKIIAFASSVNYVHPDKQDELWINEVGVAEAFRNKGIAKELLKLLFQHGKSIGCKEAWVLTDEENIPANKLYTKAGG